METEMFDGRDLDHRMYGWKTPIEALEPGMRIGFAERNKTIREVAGNWIRNLRNIGRKSVGPRVNAAPGSTLPGKTGNVRVDTRSSSLRSRCTKSVKLEERNNASHDNWLV